MRNLAPVDAVYTVLFEPGQVTDEETGAVELDRREADVVVLTRIAVVEARVGVEVEAVVLDFITTSLAPSMPALLKAWPRELLR